MDVDKVEKLDKHLVDAVLAQKEVLAPEFKHFLPRLVEAIARRPYHESQRDELTGKLQRVGRPVEPLGKAGAVLGRFQYGSLCTGWLRRPLCCCDRDDRLTLDVEAVKERGPEELGLELGDDAARGDNGVEICVLLARLAVDSPAGGVRGVAKAGGAKLLTRLSGGGDLSGGAWRP